VPGLNTPGQALGVAQEVAVPSRNSRPLLVVVMVDESVPFIVSAATPQSSHCASAFEPIVTDESNAKAVKSLMIRIEQISKK
jgi:hypothetical protein